MLKATIEKELREALKQGKSEKVSVLRLLLAVLHNREIEKQGELSDEEVVGLVEKEIKKRREAIEGFKAGGREEQAAREEAELRFLTAYLPPQLSDEALEDLVKTVIGENPGLPAGPLIGKAKSRVGQGASGERVAAVVKKLLGA